MAFTFKSPGLFAEEIDVNRPLRPHAPYGIPATIIGTSLKGRAFVPSEIASVGHFTGAYGDINGSHYGPLGMQQWLSSAKSGIFLRLLGIGDGKKRDVSGKVNNAGFVVGSQLPQENSSGFLGHNPYANIGGPPGRTFFLGCFMTQSMNVAADSLDDSTYFRDAGISTNTSIPIIRGVIMAPSGVIISLSSSLNSNNGPSKTSSAKGIFGSNSDAGALIGDVENSNSNESFVLFLNGHKGTNVISASFNTAAGGPGSIPYFADALNKDPRKIEEYGHCLYTYYNVNLNQARVHKHSSVTRNDLGVGSLAAFILTASAPRNTAVASSNSLIGIPNFENFEDRFSSARSPWVFSQKNLDMSK